MQRQTVTVTLELALEGGCLSGHASGGGAETDFHGWMGLMGAIDALLPPNDNPISEDPK